MADVQFQPDDRPSDNMVMTVRAVLFITAIIPLVICLLRVSLRGEFDPVVVRSVVLITAHGWIK